ncbi:hypothetical protein M0R45_023616 [Rubus argutus]|uniref:HTH myb-type domain-containing protein n=1 Tax=Rubus argutus TaxID=59490 RepID=A0AAW1WRW5_RUBAR
MLSRYITTHGLGSWSEVPEKAGLQRSAKGCRLRWINYLRPGIRRPSSKHLRFPPEDPLYSRYGEIMKERSLLPVEIKDQCPPNVKNTLDDEASGSTQNSVNQVNDVDGQYGGSSKQLISTDRSGGIPDKQQGVKERVALRTRSEECVYFYIPTHKSAKNKPYPSWKLYYLGEMYLVPRMTSGVCTVKLDQIISRISKLWFEEDRHPRIPLESD